MRVLLVSHSAALDAAQRSLHDLAVGLRDMKVEVVVSVPAKGPLMDLAQKSRLEVRLLPCQSWVNSRGSYQWARKYLIAQNQARSAAKWIVADRFDLVHTNSLATPVGALAAKRAEVPHIWHVREGIPVEPDYFLLSLQKVREFVANTTHAMIGPSEYACDEMKRFCPGEKVRLVYDGPLDPATTDLPFPERPNGIGEPIRILCVGKGQDVVAMAVANLRRAGISATLTVVGEVASGVRGRLARILPDGLECLGLVPDLSGVYRASHVLAIASPHESFGRAAVEAMASGCIVIGTACGDVPEIIGHRVSGVLFPPGDDAYLSKEIARLREDQEAYVSIRTAAHRDAFARFTRDRYAQAVAAVYREAMRDV